jgi:hypothetical protein
VQQSGRRTVTAVLLLALGLAAVTWAALQRAEPYLGHDESVYAARARSWATGQPSAGWEVYRPVGLPAVGRVVLGLVGALTGAEPTAQASGDGGLQPGTATVVLRVVALGLALLTLLITYLVGARLIGPPRAAVAVLVVVGGMTFVRRVPEFLDDIPAAGLLLLAAYLVLRSRRSQVTARAWSLPAAAAVAVIACLVRYGATAGLLSIAVAGLVAWGPRVWLRAWRELLGAAVVLAVGLAPLLSYSARVTGTPLGLMQRAADVAHRQYVGEGLVFYARSFPIGLAGPLGAVVMTAGLVGLALAARRLLATRRPRPTAAIAADRERVFLGAAALLALLVLGLVAHGEGRFAMFSVLTLTLLGTDSLVSGLAGRTPSALPVLKSLAVAAAVVAPLTTLQMAGRLDQVTAVRTSIADSLGQALGVAAGDGAGGSVGAAATRGGAATGAATGVTNGAAPGATVVGEAATLPCLVVTQSVPEAGWLTGCDARRAEAVRTLPAGTVVYVVDFPNVATTAGLARIKALAPDRTWTVRRVHTSGSYSTADIAVSYPADPGS